MLHSLFNLEIALHVSGGTTTYHQERKKLYLRHLVFVTPLLLPSGFGGLEVACWPLVLKFAGSSPGRSSRIFRAKNILSTPSFGGKVKPSVRCRSFTACKRSLNVTCKSAFRQNYRTFLTHSSAAGCSRVVKRVETPDGESWNV